MSELAKRTVAVIGSGPAGLMAAEVISAAGVHVIVFDRMPTVGRKLLMAGRGGLNLTHSEPFDAFMARYGAAADRMRPAIEAFDPAAARAWCEGLGQETFVGTSGRVFPKSMKASPLLRAWLRRLAQQGVDVRTRHRWIGWDGSKVVFSADGNVSVSADAVVLALGGSSWPSLGTDGSWVPLLDSAGVDVAPLKPANCGLRLAWSDHFKQHFEGQPLKRIALTHDGATVRGEIVLSAAGIEGGAVYALSAAVREQVLQAGTAEIAIDLRPDIDEPKLAAALARPRGKQSMSQFLRKTAKLSAEAIGLLQECAHTKHISLASLSAPELAASIKRVTLRIDGVSGMDRAISTAGGVSWDEIDQSFMLKARPGTFVAGEMLDWEAPTGGYLLQGCLATGAAAGRGIIEWLRRQSSVS